MGVPSEALFFVFVSVGLFVRLRAGVIGLRRDINEPMY